MEESSAQFYASFLGIFGLLFPNPCHHVKNFAISVSITAPALFLAAPNDFQLDSSLNSLTLRSRDCFEGHKKRRALDCFVFIHSLSLAEHYCHPPHEVFTVVHNAHCAVSWVLLSELVKGRQTDFAQWPTLHC